MIGSVTCSNTRCGAPEFFQFLKRDSSMLEAVRLNPHWKMLLEDFSRVNVGLATHREQVERAQQSLTDTTISAESIVDALTRLPVWIENLRKVMVTTLGQQIQDASRRYLDDQDEMLRTMETKSQEEQQSALAELRTFSAAWSKASPMTKYVPRAKEILERCGKLLESGGRKRLSLLLDEAISPFKDPEGEIGDADLHRLVTIMGSHELDKLVLSAEEKELGISVYHNIADYIAYWCEHCQEAVPLHQEVLAALKQLLRVLEAPEDGEAFHILKVLDVAVQLVAVVGTVAADVAGSSHIIPQMTHWQSMLQRHEGQRESLPARILSHVDAVSEKVKALVQQVTELVVGQWQKYKASKQAESIKCFGDEKARAEAKAGLWAAKLAATASWSELTKYAEKTLLLPSYTEKVNSFIKTVQKELTQGVNTKKDPCPHQPVEIDKHLHRNLSSALGAAYSLPASLVTVPEAERSR